MRAVFSSERFLPARLLVGYVVSWFFYEPFNAPFPGERLPVSSIIKNPGEIVGRENVLSDNVDLVTYSYDAKADLRRFAL